VVLLELDGEPYLVDTGSTNGTWVNGREIALSPLADGAEFDLGSELKLRWRVAAELSARA
jgi:pSer/pThr/pTyr-binding forkhead associated (FHA) protein